MFLSSTATSSILIIEDDARLASLISRYLEASTFHVTIADLSSRVVDQVMQSQPNLVILDLGLPGKDGFAICRELRPTFTNPILILTARASDADHIRGLELGADDYLIKPVEPRVLLARVNAALRRCRSWSEPHRMLWNFGRLTIDTAARSVRLGGELIDLSDAEFDLLAYLAARAGEVQSRETLFRNLHKRGYDGADRMLDVRISHLRRKLGDTADSATHIRTVWGRGYLFVPGEW